VPNPNQELGTKLDDNHHKLALKYINSTIKTQVEGDAETLGSLNLEVIQLNSIYLLILENYLV
jgi:hypothetical protein